MVLLHPGSGLVFTGATPALECSPLRMVLLKAWRRDPHLWTQAILCATRLNESVFKGRLALPHPRGTLHPCDTHPLCYLSALALVGVCYPFNHKRLRFSFCYLHDLSLDKISSFYLFLKGT